MQINLFRSTKPSPRCATTQLPLGLGGFREGEVELIGNDHNSEIQKNNEVVSLKKIGYGCNIKGLLLTAIIHDQQKLTPINSVDDAIGRQDYYVLVSQNAPEEEINSLFQAAKSHKTTEGSKFNPWICYSLNQNALERTSFGIHKNNSEHYKIYPEVQCSCDQIFGADESPKFVSNELLGCGGWRPHCIIMRARSVLLDYTDHFDEDLWKACKVVHDNLMSSDDDEHDFLTLREIVDFFQTHKYLWMVSTLNKDVFESWIGVLTRFMDRLFDEEDYLILRAMHHKLQDLQMLKYGCS